MIKLQQSHKYLITGANGMVGSYINYGIKTDKNTLDISDKSSVINFFDKERPKYIIHLAAETDVDLCEREPSHAYEINTIGTYNIAYVARHFGAKMIYVSTGSVFDGKKNGPYFEEDLPNPINIYSRTKYLGEIIVKDIVPEYVIIRTSRIFGGGPLKDKKFVAKIIQQLNNPEIKVVNDNQGSQTFAKDLVRGIGNLLEENKTGIYHLVNKGICSRYDMALEIVKIFKSPAKIIPVSSSYFNLDAPRGAEILGSKNDSMRPWQEALGEYLETEWNKYLIQKHG